ncbi:MAG: iron chelate uptake ABC transporter family permease subunit [Paracoccaceae bacterium]
MLDGFLIRALLAGLGVAAAAAPLGCFVVWRRMAYFGDATAHATLLGVALAFALDLPIFAGALIIALAMALVVTKMSEKGFAADTTLGVMAHTALALGLVSLSTIDGVRVDLMGFLLGDILAVNQSDLAVIWIGALLVIALLVWRWSALLTATLNEDLATAAGINPKQEQLFLTLALAVVVAVAIKVVGVLLIGAMLIIPAAAARSLAKTPEQMAMIAGALGVVATIAGLWMAWELDTPAGPSIVVAAALCYVATTAMRRS